MIEFIAAAALALAIGLFSLRVQPIFFAMATPAVAYAFNAFGLQLSGVTAARTAAKVPEALQLGRNLVKDKALGVVTTGKIRFYHLSSSALAAAFVLLLTAANSPFDTVFYSTLPRVDESLGFGAPSALCDRSIVVDSAGLRPGLEWRRFSLSTTNR